MPKNRSNPVMARELDLVDQLVAEGRDEFTFRDAVAILGGSPTAVANTMNRLIEKGLVERVIRGRYAIRPLGSLGTSSAAEDVSLAVGTAFASHEHRIAYLSALDDLGVLTHPVRAIFVACTQQVHWDTIGGRPLRLIVERPATIHLEAEQVRHSWRSTLHRALFECAMRVDLTGSVERLAEVLAVSAGHIDKSGLTRLVRAFGPRGQAATRRLASLADALAVPFPLPLEVDKRRPVIHLDPRDDRVEWIDGRYRVAWNTTINELRAVIGS
jgi:predicted transcriptional regulator of viral defense system